MVQRFTFPQRAVLVIGAVACFVSATSHAQTRTLTLEEALRLAAQQQPNLRAARAQVDASSARVGETRSGYLPRLDAQGQYQRSTANFMLSPAFARSGLASTLNIDNQLSPSDTVNYFTFGATATQTIYDFGKTGGAMDQAQATQQASRAALAGTSADVGLNVRTAYYNLLASQELVAVGEKTVGNQERHVEQVSQFVEAGTRPRIDLSSAQLTLENSRLTLLQARNARGLSRVALNAAIGIEQPSNYDVVAPAPQDLPDETRPTTELIDLAIKARPEIQRYDALLRAAEGARSSAQAGYLPNLVGTANFTGAKVEDFDPTMNWYVGAGINWNIFSGMLTANQVAEARANIAVASAQREALRQQIRSEVEAQVLALEEAKARLEVATRAVALGEERLKLAEVRYEAGAGDIIELEDAQVSDADARATRVRATYDVEIARARLARALGKP